MTIKASATRGPRSSRLWYRTTKRLLDVTVSALGLALLSPVIALGFLLVSFTIGRPALFVQDRTGLNGRSFRLYKFRTMRDLLDEQGRPRPDAERLTRLGRFLRALSLDELPTLANVLKGDMTLVGPRPLLPEYLHRYTSEQVRRHEVKPGITGLAQVNGRNALTWEEKFGLDVWYVDHASLLLDLKILLLTIPMVLMRKGVSRPGHATMPEFTGPADSGPGGGRNSRGGA